MGIHAHNASTWKAEAAGGSCAPMSGLHSWTLSKKMLVFFDYFLFFMVISFLLKKSYLQTLLPQ